MYNYSMEFILKVPDLSEQEVTRSLSQAAANLRVSEISVGAQENETVKNFQVNVETQDPTLIFDICSQLGRISAIKVEEKA